MNSRFYRGEVVHTRLRPVRHAFRNRVSFFEFDLTELSELDRTLSGFGFNRFAPLSLRARDYLDGSDATFAEKLRPWIDSLQLTAPPSRIALVTCARWWGRVFNPVSFYVLHDAADAPVGLVAEVNNTFGDRHVYATRLEMREGLPGSDHPKEFHVSPFNSMEGEYRFSLRRDADSLYVGVDLYRDGEKIIETWIEGRGEALRAAAVWRYQLRHPLQTWLTFPRILVQAVKLRFKHHLPVFRRTEPSHPHTLRTRGQPRS